MTLDDLKRLRKKAFTAAALPHALQWHMAYANDVPALIAEIERLTAESEGKQPFYSCGHKIVNLEHGVTLDVPCWDCANAERLAAVSSSTKGPEQP